MKHLTLYLSNLLSIAVFLFSTSALAGSMRRYVCQDALSELTLSLEVMNAGFNSNGVLTAISDAHTIQANIESVIPTSVGYTYTGHEQGGRSQVIFKTHLDDAVFNYNTHSTSLTCTIMHVNKSTYTCIKYSCGSHGVVSTPLEVPLGYQCIDRKPSCKT